jgi:hypothetical protein
MAMTLDDIAAILDEMGFGYNRSFEESIAFSMQMQTYHRDGAPDEKLLDLMVQLPEDGEYFALYAPSAYRVQGEHEAAFLQACAMVQWGSKLVQFEWDHTDGEVRPIVEFPLEDHAITRKQFERCVAGICEVLDHFDASLRRAATTGVVEMPAGNRPEAGDRSAFEELVARVKAVLTGRPYQPAGDGDGEGGRASGPPPGRPTDAPTTASSDDPADDGPPRAL